MTKRIPISNSLGVDHSLEMMRHISLEGEDTIIVALNFRCNSKCRFCIIEHEIEERLEHVDIRVFEELFRFNHSERQFTRLTISGAEATLRTDLVDIVQRAVRDGGFETIRIQTNGRRLAKRTYAKSLVDAGLNEYFVSVHGADQEHDAYITRDRASFDQMREGIGNLLELGARVITNTVVCAENAHRLVDIANLLGLMGVREAQFWNFLEIGDVGQKDSLVRVTESIPHLRRAIQVLLAQEIEVTVKWFPRCLLGEYGEHLNNHQPQMLIQDEFQNRLSHNFGFRCAHQAICGHFGNGCDGLHERYHEVFGDEAEHLRPKTESQ